MAKTKTENGVSYPDSAYAYAPDPESPSTWKLRCKEYVDGELKLTRAQLARAMQAMSSAGFRVNQVDIPRDDIPGVKRKLRGFWRELDLPMDEMPAHMKETRTTGRDGGAPPCAIRGVQGSALVESRAEGKVWDVVIIRAGRSDNGRIYPRSTLERAAPLFEGAKAFVFGRQAEPAPGDIGFQPVIFDHLSEEELAANPKGFIKNLVGYYRNPRMEGDELKAELHILDSESWLKDKLRSAWDEGVGDLVGLSIDAQGIEEQAEPARGIGGLVGPPIVKEIVKVDSVDLVTYPAAGGKFERLVASNSGHNSVGAGSPRPGQGNPAPTNNGGGGMDWKELIETLKKYTDEQLKSFLDENPEVAKRVTAFLKPGGASAGAPPDGGGAGAAPGTGAATTTPEVPAGALPAELGESVKKWLAAEQKKLAESAAKVIDLEKKLRERECRAVLQEKVLASGLPDPMKAKLLGQWEGHIVAGHFEAAELDKAIEAERGALAKLAESQGLKWGFGKPKADLIADENDKLFKRLDGFFANEDIKFNGIVIPRYKSFKEAYIEITGDLKVTGQVTKRLREALASTSWAEILGDSITRRMVAEYNAPGLQEWRKISSDIVPVSDFRTQRRMRMGGYGTLPAVAQSGSYDALTSPTDEESTYAPSKRGGTETVTIEAIKNDDVGAIRRIPQRLGRAAAQTLYRFVFDFIRANSNIYDATALFTAGHGNLGSAALSYANLDTAIVAMADQQAYGDTSEVLGLKPRHLIVPNELRETAWQLIYTATKPETANRNDNMFATMGMDLIVIPYWTDANNWYLAADPRDIPTIEIGFMDGQEEPELFVQDLPNVGSMFNNDQLTYKVRHIYGGAVLDFRGFYGALVT